MERVQFQQEQMLAELKDLVQKGLFTQKEVKQIMLKRTSFETALVRRIPKKSDFLRYATYEMSLEALRRKRVERLKIPKGPSSVSDYALVRRQFQIFERALKKFKGDVGLWLQYIQVAKKEGARALVGRITARALQLHPNVPALYVLAASHELDHLSPTAARALLQRGIRLNADSIEMWREYVRMELGFVESLRRRWSVLGIDVKGKGKTIDKGKGRERDADDPWDGLGQEGDVLRMDVDEAEEAEEDEVARRQIMEGAIVKSAISSAVKAIPKIGLFTSLHELVSTYPSPAILRESLLDHLHEHLREALPSSPAAIKLSATRHLRPELSGEALVDALKGANEILLEEVKSVTNQGRSGIADVYAEFVEEWCGKDVDDTLKAYLITSLHLLIQQLPAPVPAALLAVHIRLLVSHHTSIGPGLLPAKANTPEKILRIARKHTEKASHSSVVWLARLGTERRLADKNSVNQAWAEARKNVIGEGIEAVWLWGLEAQNRTPSAPRPSEEDCDIAEADTNADVQLLEHLLHEGQLIRNREPAAAGALHEVLLIRYAAATHRAQVYQACQIRTTHGPGSEGRNGHENTSAISPEAPRSPPPRPDAKSSVTAHRDTIARGGFFGAATTSSTLAGDSVADRVLEARLARVRHLGGAYAPSARVWAEVFKQESGEHGGFESGRAQTSAGGVGASDRYFEDGDGDERVLRAVYELWRQKDGVEATVAWATWLLRRRSGKDAVALVARARSVLGEIAGAEVERRWKAVLDGASQSNVEEDADVPDEENTPQVHELGI